MLPRQRTGDREPLRVGVLLDGYTQPAWVARTLETVTASSIASLVLVVKNEAPVVVADGWVRRRVSDWRHLLYMAYRKVDDELFHPTPDAFAAVDVGPLVKSAAVIAVEPRMTTYSDYFSEADVAAIRAYDLDVALRFGFRILRGDALRIARYGVWSYHHGDNTVNRGGPAGFWEVLEGTPVTGSVLQILTEQLDGGQVIYRSYAATDRLSVKRNRNNYYWKTSDFVIRKLADVHDGGAPAVAPEPAEYRPYSHRLYRRPTNGEMARLLWQWGTSNAGRALRRISHPSQWTLAYQLGVAPAAPELHRFRRLAPPADRMWADPFPVKHGDRYYVFLEELVYRRGPGYVAVMALDEAGNHTPPVPVLKRPYHLSYPFVFEWQGTYYMIPETRKSRRIELYRCTRFPDAWELDRVLMDEVNAVDTTLVHHGGTWWMFTCLAVEGALNWDELHVFHADTPLGPWRPHRRNPVKSDVRSARPAGRFFCRDGTWYRPAQDCSQRYGYAVSINKVLRLDADAYEETEVAKLLPNWSRDLRATHTLNSVDALTIVDCEVRRPRIRLRG
jgi:hypothetical protein